MASRLEVSTPNQQLQAEDRSLRTSIRNIWKALKSGILAIWVFAGLWHMATLPVINTFVSNLFGLTARKEQDETNTKGTTDTFLLIICLSIISTAVVVIVIRYYTQNDEKPTKNAHTEAPSETNSDHKNQQIDDVLIDILQKLLNEPVPMSQVRQRKDKICSIWLALKQLHVSHDLQYETELKLVKLAQNIVELFADDSDVMQITITLLHNRICLKPEMFQNVTDGFLENLLNFCEVHESAYKWKAIEILLCHLHACNDVLTDSSLCYQNVLLKLRAILQKADISETTYVTFSKFKLYYAWLNDSNVDVVQCYAAFAIYHLIQTERTEVKASIINLVDVDKLLKILNKSKMDFHHSLPSRQLQNMLNEF